MSELRQGPVAVSDDEELVLGLAADPDYVCDADRERATFSLQPWMAGFPRLKSLTIRGHVYPAELSHPSVEQLTLIGDVSLTPLRFPELKRLVMSMSSDEDGVACGAALFEWIGEADRFPKLASLDLRALDVEDSVKVFVPLLANSAVLRRLEHLGLIDYEDAPVAVIKKHKAAFSHLTTWVISNNRSAHVKNPVGANAVFEMEFDSRTVRLEDVPAAVAALPQVDGLNPKLSDQELVALREELLEVKQRFPEQALTKMIGRFVRARQWKRVDQMLLFAKAKAPHRRAFMEVREAVQKQVGTALKKRADVEGQALFARLEEANRL